MCCPTGLNRNGLHKVPLISCSLGGGEGELAGPNEHADGKYLVVPVAECCSFFWEGNLGGGGRVVSKETQARTHSLPPSLTLHTLAGSVYTL